MEPMNESPEVFRHSDRAEANRAAKAKTLARWLWDRGIDGDDLIAFSPAHRRRVARAAGVNPPSGIDTWAATAELLDAKAAWVADHPGHPSGLRAHEDERAAWAPEPAAGSGDTAT